MICLAVDNKLPSIKPKTILFSFLVASFVPQLLVFFQYIRTLNIVDLSLINLYSLYLQFIQDSQLLDQIGNSQTLNLVTRPLLHSVLAFLVRIDNLTFTGFQDLHDSFLQALPSFVVGSKAGLYGSKGLLVEATGIDIDWISSPPTMSYLSFGIIGFLLYPLFYVVIFYLYSTLVLSLLKIRFSPIVLIIFFAFLLSNVTQGMPEGTTISYLRSFVMQSIILFSVYISSAFTKFLTRI